MMMNVLLLNVLMYQYYQVLVVHKQILTTAAVPVWKQVRTSSTMIDTFYGTLVSTLSIACTGTGTGTYTKKR